ncbi:hypothetical protein QUF72_12430 [Desulfobacterales bacterium HSG2]|nr:hypothetical protein [Desulfobacterales bacterium HSG2]
MKKFAIVLGFLFIVDLCFLPGENKFITPLIKSLFNEGVETRSDGSDGISAFLWTRRGFSIFLKKGESKRILGEKVLVEFVGKEGGLISKEKIVVRLYVPPDEKPIYCEFYEGHSREHFKYYRKTYFIDLMKVKGKGDNLEVELFFTEK